MANDESPRFRPVDPEGALPRARALDPRVLGGGRRLPSLARSSARAPRNGSSTTARRPRTRSRTSATPSTRTFKDVYPRYRTMTGHLVHRKAGWDCHGLPVEIEVEKEIGTTGKSDIEAFGVAEFNERCRVSVRRYVGDWEELTRADRLLDRHGRRLLDDGPRLHRVRLVVAEAAARARPARRGRQGDRVLPAMRDGAVGRRGGSGLRDRRGPERLRPVPDRRGRRARRSWARRSSCGRRRRGRSLEHRRRGGPRRPTTPWPSTTASG